MKVRFLNWTGIRRWALSLIMLNGAASICFSDEKPSTQDLSQESTARPDSISELVQQLGAPSSIQRREAYNKLLRLGMSAAAEIDKAANSSNREVADAASRLRVLIKVVDKCETPEQALEVADLFLIADEEHVGKLIDRGLWDLVDLYLKEHQSLVSRIQQNFYQDLLTWHLIQRVIDRAQMEGRMDRAWPIVSQMVPTEVALWTANKLSLPLPHELEDAHEQALELFYSGKIDQALEQKISPQLRAHLAARSFRWKLFQEKSLQQTMLGSQIEIAHQAAAAVLKEMAEDHSGSQDAWRRVLSLNDDDPLFGEKDLQSSIEALLAEAPISEQPEVRADISASSKPGSYNQLQFALMLSGRSEAIEQYLLKEGSPSSFSLLSRSNYGRAFEHIGLQSDLSNFDEWFTHTLGIARQGLRAYERSQDSDLTQLQIASNLGQVASILAGLGHKDRAKKILQELVALCNRSRGENDGWDRCVFRWLGSDCWRDLCIEVIGQNFEKTREEHRAMILEKLFPHLAVAALPLLLESPAVRDSNSDWYLGFEQLGHLERCDRQYFGSEASQTIRAWIFRAANAVRSKVASDSPLEERELPTFTDQTVRLALSKLAADWEDISTAFDLTGIGGSQPVTDFELLLQAARIALKSNQPQLALQCIDAAEIGPRDQHWKSLIRIEALLKQGKLDEAVSENQLQWMRCASLGWRGDQSAAYRVADDLINDRRWQVAAEYCERTYLIERSTSYYSFWIARQYASVLHELKQDGHSADVMRGVLLGMLKTSSTVLPEIEVVRYVAERERISRAVALVQRGDFQAARIQLDIAYRLHPQDVDAVVNCYPLLREAGQLELAQELFKQYEAALLQQLKAWPNDAMALNNLAWMYAKSDEKLDQAYQLSRQAVMLVPNSAVYLDTLAEVQFHRGDIEEALATMRNCVRLDPRAPNYRKNLVRFSSARH